MSGYVYDTIFYKKGNYEEEEEEEEIMVDKFLKRGGGGGKRRSLITPILQPIFYTVILTIFIVFSTMLNGYQSYKTDKHIKLLMTIGRVVWRSTICFYITIFACKIAYKMTCRKKKFCCC
jgi:hypothetical protein